MRSVCRFGWLYCPVAALPWHDEQFWRNNFAPAAIASGWLSNGFSRLRSFSGTLFIHAPSPTEANNKVAPRARPTPSPRPTTSSILLTLVIYFFLLRREKNWSISYVTPKRIRKPWLLLLSPAAGETVNVGPPGS